MMIAILIAAIVVALVVFSFLCYKKAPPTQAIVVTGFGLSRPKVVCGRGVFVLPVVQRADRLNMRLLKIDVKTPETGVKTKEGVSLWLDSVVTVQVYSENSTVSDEEVRNAGYDDIKKYINSRQQAAISNFLGMDEAHINEKINDVLQGNLREIVSEMTVDQILTNRKQMAVSVVENARPDLAKMGLEVVTFNVQDVKDAIDAQGHNHGVIEAIGVEQEELVKKRASIANVVLLEQINIVVDALEPRDAGQCVSLAVIAVNGSAGIRELRAEVAHIGQIAKFCVLQGRSGRFADDVGTFTGRKLGIHDGVVVGVVDELILDLNIGNSLAQIVKQCLDGVLAVPVGHAQRNLVTGCGAFCRSAAGSALSGGAARGGGRGATAGGEGQSHRRCEHGCDCFFHVCFPPCSVFCFRWLYCTRNVQNAK